MSDEGVRSEAVDRAVAWLHQYSERYTRDGLVASLQEQGYTGAEIEAALARVGAEAAGRDLRGRGAAILSVAFIGTWLLVTLLAGSRWGGGSASLVAVILGIALGIVYLPSLVIVSNSDRLRRGVEGALVAMLAVPFVLLVVIAGICVGTTNMLGG